MDELPRRTAGADQGSSMSLSCERNFRASFLVTALVLGDPGLRGRHAGDQRHPRPVDHRPNSSSGRLDVGRATATACHTLRPPVEQIQDLSELVTLRVAVVDILQVEQDGWVSGYKGAWLVHGDALWTTDLQQARVRKIPASPANPSSASNCRRPLSSGLDSITPGPARTTFARNRGFR